MSFPGNFGAPEDDLSFLMPAMERIVGIKSVMWAGVRFMEPGFFRLFPQAAMNGVDTPPTLVQT